MRTFFIVFSLGFQNQSQTGESGEGMQRVSLFSFRVAKVSEFIAIKALSDDAALPQ
jgi:hypothetical protein